MEDLSGKVLLNGYGVKLYNYSRTRKGTICKTDKGMLEVRKNNSSANNIIFEHDAMAHLKNSDFKNVDNFLKTVDNNNYFEIDGTKYVVCNYIEGDNFDLKDTKKCNLAVETMAKMHEASKGFISGVEVSNIGKTPLLFQKRNAELTKIKKLIKNKSLYSDVDLVVLKNYEYVKDKLMHSTNLISNANYDAVIKKAISDKCFCHNAYKSENIKSLNEDGVFLTGFSKCAYDTCIVDLAEFMRRYLKNENANYDDLCEIYDQYNKIRNVSKEEKMILNAILVYPYKFLKILNEHYNKRRVYTSSAVVDKLKRCINESKKNEPILTEFLKL